MNVVYLMEWVESDRARGKYLTRHDGYSLHISREACAAYEHQHWASLSPACPAPEVYSRPEHAEPRCVTVTDETLYAELQQQQSLRFAPGQLEVKPGMPWVVSYSRARTEVLEAHH